MLIKILSTLIVMMTVVSAHHAYSSQYIYRHDGPAQKVIIHDKHGHHYVNYHAHPKYKFEYKVDDYHTGDHKHQQEWRDGDDTDSKYSYHVKHIVPQKHHDTKEHHHEAVKHHRKEWEQKHHLEWQHDHLHFFDYYAYPKFEFGYKVHDPHTGDNKQHHEHRDGHDTKSHYFFHLKHIVPEKHHHW